MDTVSVVFSLPEGSDLESELLIYELGGLGYEGFVEENEKIEAYIIADQFNKQHLEALLQQERFKRLFVVSIKEHKEQNWNALWEASYSDVIINNRCRVRAPFHEVRPDIEFDLLIEPRMSFGTAHHETTHLMIGLLLELQLTDRSLVDMGCGTAVLAILGRKLGAFPVYAIDNDEWAVDNARDNVQLNNTGDISVIAGDARQLAHIRTDFLLANINRNILLQDMSAYWESINKGGTIILSGFFEEDLGLINDKCVGLGLIFTKHLVRNRWCAAVFNKP